MKEAVGRQSVQRGAKDPLSAVPGDRRGTAKNDLRSDASANSRALRRDLLRLVRTARALGLTSLSSVVVRIAERLDPGLRAGELAPRDIAMLRRFADRCCGYLADPTDVKAADAVVELLAVEPLAAVGCWERIHLLLGLIEEGTEAARMRALCAAASSGDGHDPLTGLCDESALRGALEDLLSAPAARQAPVGVMSIGITGVEDIVDSFGDNVGTAVLARIAADLIRSVPCGAVLGRLGADRFVVIRDGLTSAQLAEEARRLAELICRSHEIGGHLVAVTAHIGLAVGGQHGHDAAELLANADVALHEARVRRLHTAQFFAPHMREEALRRVSLEGELRAAIERGEFELHYQPKLALCTGRVCGVEALVRWRCPTRGLVAPGEFIPIAEESGLIVRLGDWVIDAACRQIMSWQREHAPPLPVAINLSAIQLCAPQTGPRILQTLQRYGVHPRMVEVEVTESAVMRDADAALRCLSEVGREGVRVVIDDFGTGYSNLSQLMRLPLAAIKIDKSLVARIAMHERDAAIARAIIDIARTLGARVVAEGVESAQQRDLLAAAGCDEYQGFLIAKPMDATHLQAWLSRQAIESHLG
jgi:diguanylate cyclase (GGDEF)-like protein